jgi:hypothetical protein
VAITITRIPEPYRLGLAKIKTLTPEAVTAISDAMATVTPGGGIKGVIAAVQDVQGVGNEDAAAIVRALYSLYAYRVSTETPLADFVPVIITAMQASGKDSLALSADERGPFSERLTRLLGMANLEITSKVELLRQDYGRIFCDAKILTDLRPVFADPGAPPVGMAITHTLKIVCHDSGEHKELYFALDTDDINKLTKVLERAVTKASSLKSIMQAANLKDLS